MDYRIHASTVLSIVLLYCPKNAARVSQPERGSEWLNAAENMFTLYGMFRTIRLP